MGELYRKDLTIFRHYFKEQARLLGIKVLYQYPVEMEFTVHGQEEPLGYSEPMEMDIIFDASPKLATLKRLGWVSEDPSDKPYLVRLPYDAPNLQKGCLLTLPVPFPLSDARVFKITEISLDQVFPESYYCKVAPKLDKKETEKEVEETYKEKPYGFLNVPDGDELHNDLGT